MASRRYTKRATLLGADIAIGCLTLFVFDGGNSEVIFIFMSPGIFAVLFGQGTGMTQNVAKCIAIAVNVLLYTCLILLFERLTSRMIRNNRSEINASGEQG